jgi:methyl-accepting chemotaxis protein
MTNLMQKSLKVRVFVTFLAVAVVAVSALGAVSYFSGKHMLQKQIQDSYTNISNSREGEVVLALEAAKVEFALVAGDYHIRELAEKVVKNDPDAPRALSELIAYAKEFLVTTKNSFEYFIVDMQGRILASTDEDHIGIDRSRDAYFIHGQKGLYIKDVYKSDVTGQVGFAVAGPLQSVHSGELLGVFCIRRNLDQMNAIIANHEGMGHSGDIYIVNKDGYIFTNSVFEKEAALTKKVETEPVKLWQSQKKEFEGLYRGFTGEMVIGASHGAGLAKATNDLGWLLIAKIDAREAFAPIQKLGITILLIGCVISILVALIAYRIASGIVNPITAIAKVAQRVGEGDLTQNVAETKAQDEIGNLTTGFRNMITGLRTILLKVQEATGQITASGTEILAASQEQASAAREQSSAVAETTSAAKELSTTSESVGESIKKVAQVASHAMAGMAKIKESIDKTNGMLNSLGEKSQKIGKITDLIDDVADQTNLLAVNASIEAARAGEQGRGFTVVADEIRKLADSTAKSTKDITSLIELIQHEMSNAIMSMEQSIQSVDEEARLAQQTTEKTKEIAMSTHQQISGAKQIADAMMNIDETMKQVAAGAQQSQAAVKQLTSMAGELNHLASKFKL